MSAPLLKLTTNRKIACTRASCWARIWLGNAAAALALAAWYPMVIWRTKENEEQHGIASPRTEPKAASSGQDPGV
jgi:hypothetical protein